MRNIGGYAELLGHAHAGARADVQRLDGACLRAAQRGERERLRALEIARAEAAQELGEIEGEYAFPELLDGAA